MNPEVYVAQLELGPMKNFVYLVGPKSGRETFVVDPAWDVDAIEARLEADGRKLTAAFVTHAHHDHINGLPTLLERHDVPVYAQGAEIDFSEELAAAAGALRRVSPGDVVSVGALPITAIHTPGHTPGAQCLLCGGVLLSGDTLFIQGCGRCDFPGSDPHQMYRSLHHVLATVPDDVTLLHGHNYASKPTAKMDEVRRENPYLQLKEEEAFVTYRMTPR